MLITPIKTPIFHKGDSLINFLSGSLENKSLENTILAITSKIVSLNEEATIPPSSVISKIDLVKREADYFLEEQHPVHSHMITIKQGVLIPSAGIDESNSEDQEYILYPKDPMRSSENIWMALKEKFKLKHFGIIITDSHTTPLRTGVTGVGLAWCGFSVFRSYIGSEDLFGRKFKFTYVNILDSLAVSAVFVMGEGNESQPIALIENIPQIEFMECAPFEEEIKRVKMPIEEDLYSPILKNCIWKTLKQ